VHVHRFEQLRRDGDRVELLIECSAGTYVRSLVAGLGDAYCEALRRTAVGPFRVDDADPGRVLGLADALRFLPSVELGPDDARAAAHGRSVPGRAEGPVLLLDPEGPVAVAEPRDGALKPTVGFRP
jgi:tRNA pseudouridine55 synthase